MLTNSKHLHGLQIAATDGDLGTLNDIYFDDCAWTVRYLTVDTGGWLGGRQVLISPMSVTGIDLENKRLKVSLNMAQIKNCPDIEEHQPVSRQYEENFLTYYGLAPYWQEPKEISSPIIGFGVEDTETMTDEVSINLRKKVLDSRLRSRSEISGYYIEASDGEIGHADALIVDTADWTIRYIEVDTRNWWPGKKVLISPQWVHNISWQESKIQVKIPRASIQECEEYDDANPITRDYEQRIYAHYARPPYWVTSTR